jgi:hypothetical protein
MSMGDFGSTTSRRAFLGVVAAGPIAALAENPAAKGAVASIAALRCRDLEMPPPLDRSRAGRNASRFRYHNAESFFRMIERGIVRDAHDQLYQTGIVLQLGLSSHLFDVGFTDEWCARHIGLNVARSLGYANATGFGFDWPEFDLLAAILSPYSRWRFAERPVGDLPITPSQMRTLTRELLDHVHNVTGHPRPRGWSARHD